jgi:hypothetical protein
VKLVLKDLLVLKDHKETMELQVLKDHKETMELQVLKDHREMMDLQALKDLLVVVVQRYLLTL